MDIDSAIEQSHGAWQEFANGNPEAAMAAYAHTDNASLANPFGATATGWEEVKKALAYASSRFHDGALDGVDQLAIYATKDLVTVFEIEHWRIRVGDRVDVEPFDLRVSTTWRKDTGDWKIVHRHADPIRTFDEYGPLRAT